MDDKQPGRFCIVFAFAACAGSVTGLLAIMTSMVREKRLKCSSIMLMYIL